MVDACPQCRVALGTPSGLSPGALGTCGHCNTVLCRTPVGWKIATDADLPQGDEVRVVMLFREQGH